MFKQVSGYCFFFQIIENIYKYIYVQFVTWFFEGSRVTILDQNCINWSQAIVPEPRVQINSLSAISDHQIFQNLFPTRADSH